MHKVLRQNCLTKKTQSQLQGKNFDQKKLCQSKTRDVFVTYNKEVNKFLNNVCSYYYYYYYKILQLLYRYYSIFQEWGWRQKQVCVFCCEFVQKFIITCDKQQEILKTKNGNKIFISDKILLGRVN
eukprot:TRINITY_DN8039_c1_g3_i1.p3 TRINITY_DN8039_c1_g3~~TRINITY_DN8039_c1_g3_i1.p3  ORF type:complete len:126 (+),score=6.16 TRINITY_DN8039_c1_g3_i1:800-1177(+)